MAQQESRIDFSVNPHDFVELLRKYNVPWEEVAPYIKEHLWPKNVQPAVRLAYSAGYAAALNDLLVKISGAAEADKSTQFPR